MHSIPVTASRSYDILIGQNILPELFTHRGGLSDTKRVCIFTDSCVKRLHLPKLTALLNERGVSYEVFAFPNGEASKNLDTLGQMLNFLAQNNFSQGEKILALGGGVVGDISALAAAVYLRGVECIQIPTTLLSAVDSSVGGKCAVDLPTGKNLIGTFYQPSLVLCDTTLLETLPEHEVACGMAEVLKYALGFDEQLFALCENGSDGKTEEIIATCVRIKRDVVAKDEFDRGERKKLNLGHTPAHAIEALSGFKIPHGIAVGMGLSLMAHTSLHASDAARLDRVLSLYNLPTEIPFAPELLAKAALSDKKRTGNTISLIIPQKIGRCEICETPTDKLETLFRQGLK